MGKCPVGKTSACNWQWSCTQKIATTVSRSILSVTRHNRRCCWHVQGTALHQGVARLCDNQAAWQGSRFCYLQRHAGRLTSGNLLLPLSAHTNRVRLSVCHGRACWRPELGQDMPSRRLALAGKPFHCNYLDTLYVWCLSLSGHSFNYLDTL